MNKQGKTNLVVVLVVIALAVLLFFILSGGTVKTVLEHKTPADISKEEEGTGLDLRFYDKDGNEIQIPEWFTTASVVPGLGDFTIVRRTTAPTCTAVSQCAGYITNPNIMCWTGKCVLGNVASMTAGVSVTNPTSSEVSFLNIAPTTVSPTAFNTALDKTAYTKLSPGGTKSWSSTTMSVGVWEGTQQTFSVSVSGTNEYTGQIVTVSDSITLAFDKDPSGTFSVVVQTPVPS